MHALEVLDAIKISQQSDKNNFQIEKYINIDKQKSPIKEIKEDNKNRLDNEVKKEFTVIKTNKNIETSNVKTINMPENSIKKPMNVIPISKIAIKSINSPKNGNALSDRGNKNFINAEHEIKQKIVQKSPENKSKIESKIVSGPNNKLFQVFSVKQSSEKENLYK